MTKLRYLALPYGVQRRNRIVKTAIWHASSRLWSTVPIEQRIREQRQEQDGGALPIMPSQYGRWQRCRQRRHRETQAQCRHMKASKTAATGKPALSNVQALAVITGALASGAAAGIITARCPPDGGEQLSLLNNASVAAGHAIVIAIELATVSGLPLTKSGRSSRASLRAVRQHTFCLCLLLLLLPAEHGLLLRYRWLYGR